MPGKHAKLSPSAAERWIECPASIRMQEKVPVPPESPYAAEGTAAHALGELKAALAFGKITQRTFNGRVKKWRKEFEDSIGDNEQEMQEHTDAYVELLEERVAVHMHSQLMLEQRMDTGVPSSWGTSDAVIVSPTHVEIVDFKYGAGVAVEAEGNPQLRLYALGALDTYGDLLGETEAVFMTVHQPRMDHVLTAEMTPDALRAWRSDVATPRAELALTDDAPFGPSDQACRWCPASGRCKAQVEAVFAEPFEVDETLSPEDVAANLERIPLVREWLKAFEEQALNMAYSEGTAIPGHKVVLSGGQRSVQDHDKAIEVLIAEGYDIDVVANVKAKGIGDLEKLLGKDRFKELLEEPGLVKKSSGKPSLVPESDKRQAIAPNSEAAKEFANAEEAL